MDLRTRLPVLKCRFYAYTKPMDRTAFDDFFDEQMADPARAEAYREARTEIDTYDRFMRAVNALRESHGVSRQRSRARAACRRSRSASC